MIRRAQGIASVVMGLGILVLGADAFAAASEQPAAAAEEPKVICPICQKANDPQANYADKALNTLGRGALNTVFGWTELIRQPATEAKQGGNVMQGLGNGVGEGLKRTFGGLGEVLTFWTPKTNDKYLKISNDCPVCMGQR